MHNIHIYIHTYIEEYIGIKALGSRGRSLHHVGQVVRIVAGVDELQLSLRVLRTAENDEKGSGCRVYGFRLGCRV